METISEWIHSHLAPRFDTQQNCNMKISSTIHCLINLLDFALKNLKIQEKTSVALVFIDFRKAFDLVHHTNVINIANDLGLHPTIVSWLTDFLAQRSQVARYQEVASPLQPVPRGPKVGSLLFLILINDSLTHLWKRQTGQQSSPKPTT